MIPTIHVIATTLDGTRAALEAAAPFAARQRARVVLLVPEIPAAEVEGQPHSINWLIARYDEMSRDIDPRVQIRVCLGPNLAKTAKRMTPADATIFVGGRTSVFWPGAEERLAASLRRSGREVVFVGCDSGKASGHQRPDIDA